MKGRGWRRDGQKGEREAVGVKRPREMSRREWGREMERILPKRKVEGCLEELAGNGGNFIKDRGGPGGRVEKMEVAEFWGWTDSGEEGVRN